MGKKHTSVLRESQWILAKPRRCPSVHSLRNAAVLERRLAVNYAGGKRYKKNAFIFYGQTICVYYYYYYYNINNVISV